MLTTIVSFVVLLLVLIFVHEMGHFLAAKMMGVKVERFSLGFPPKAWSKVIGETEYQLAWLPLGGYVKMYGEDPTSDEKIPPEMEKRSFSHQPAWSKMIIVVAGALFNLVFAALLFWGLIWFGGIPHLAPIVGPVAMDSPAAKAGIQMDDVLVSVNGVDASYFDILDKALEDGQGAPVEVVIKRAGQPLQTHLLTPDRRDIKDLLGDPVTYWDVGISNRTQPIIKKVGEGKPAQRAGMLAGDRIISINGQPTVDWVDVVEGIKGPLGQRNSVTPQEIAPLLFEVERGGRRLTLLPVAPEITTALNAAGETTFSPLMGIEVENDIVIESVGLLRAAYMGGAEAWNMIKLTLLSVQKLVTGQISVKAMGGPILIAEVTGDRAEAGFVALLSLAAFISINLGILNLLPIPVLDGGQLVFFFIEAIRRKPLSVRVREIAQWVGMAMLGTLMVVVFYNDISRLVTRFMAISEIESQQSVAPVAPGKNSGDTKDAAAPVAPGKNSGDTKDASVPVAPVAPGKNSGDAKDASVPVAPGKNSGDAKDASVPVAPGAPGKNSGDAKDAAAPGAPGKNSLKIQKDGETP